MRLTVSSLLKRCYVFEPMKFSIDQGVFLTRDQYYDRTSFGYSALENGHILKYCTCQSLYGSVFENTVVTL